MTYLVITPFLPTPGHWWGGYVYDQIAAIKRTGMFDRIIVFRTMPPGKQFDYDINEFHVYGMPFLSMPSNILGGNPFQDYVNINHLRKQLSKIDLNIEEIDAVHLHTSQMSGLAKYFKKSNKNCITLLQHHDLDTFGVLNGKFSDRRWNTRYKAKRSIAHYKDVDFHICISEECRENLLQFPNIREETKYEPYNQRVKLCEGLNTKINGYRVLYNGVDTSIFHPSSERSENSLFTVGCVGGIFKLKNQITLVKAIEYCAKEKGINDICLKIIGTGVLRGQIEEYINNNNLEKYITFVPTCNHDELTEFYNSIDLFCLPSYFEGFGCVFTEAYACGVPFMTCRHQGMEYHIEESQKPTFMLEDPLDFKRLGEMIINFKTKRPKQELIVPYDINVLVSDYCQWICEIINRTKN